MNRRPITNIAIVAVFFAAILIVGSAAFSAISVDRSASINVAGDDSALLQITSHSSADSQNVFQDNGNLKIVVGQDTTTTYEKLFVITNRGTQTVGVWLEDHDYTGGGDHGNLAGDIVGDQDDDNTGSVTLFNSSFGGADSCENGVKSVEDQPNAIDLTPGSSLVVGILADADSVDGDEADLLDEITIHADASVDGWDMTSNTPACS